MAKLQDNDFEQVSGGVSPEDEEHNYQYYQDRYNEIDFAYNMLYQRIRYMQEVNQSPNVSEEEKPDPNKLKELSYLLTKLSHMRNYCVQQKKILKNLKLLK